MIIPSIPPSFHSSLLPSLPPSILPSLPGIASPPISPTHNTSTCTCATVTWEQPAFDGTAVILSYTINFSSLNSTTRNETAPSYATSQEICNLSPNVLYMATIVASNAVGESSGVDFVIFIEADRK